MFRSVGIVDKRCVRSHEHTVLLAIAMVKQEKLAASRLNRTRIQASENGWLPHRIGPTKATLTT